MFFIAGAFILGLGDLGLELVDGFIDRGVRIGVAALAHDMNVPGAKADFDDVLTLLGRNGNDKLIDLAKVPPESFDFFFDVGALSLRNVGVPAGDL